MLKRNRNTSYLQKIVKPERIGEKERKSRLFLPFKFFSGETMAPVSHMHCNSPIQTSQAPAVFLSWFLLREQHSNSNSVYIFLFWELRALSPNFQIHVSVRIYIFPGSVHIFPPAEKADPSWEYIIRSQTHECGNWDWGPNIPFLGIFVSNFRHFVFAVMQITIKKDELLAPLSL